MKRFAVLSLALILGVATALTAGHLAVAKTQNAHAKAQWAEVYRTPGGLVAGADLIVVAKHVLASPGRIVGGTPFTYNGFEIQRVLKGRYNGSDLAVERTGGLMEDGTVLDIDDGGRFVPGHEYLLFLKAQGARDIYYQINHQARYEIDNGLLKGVDPTDGVVASFHGRTLGNGLDMIERRVRMVQ